MKTAYEILGVTRQSSDDDVKLAYRRRARELHPDRNGGVESPEFAELGDAYASIKDDAARDNYGRKLHFHGARLCTACGASGVTFRTVGFHHREIKPCDVCKGSSYVF